MFDGAHHVAHRLVHGQRFQFELGQSRVSKVKTVGDDLASLRLAIRRSLLTPSSLGSQL